MCDNSIRVEALKKSCNLETLRKEGMKMESAAMSGAEISGEVINKMGKYSLKALKNNKPKPAESRKTINCYSSGNGITECIAKHKASCPVRNAKYRTCGKPDIWSMCVKARRK